VVNIYNSTHLAKMLLAITMFFVGCYSEEDCPEPYTGAEDSTIQYIPYKAGCRGSITSPGAPRNYPSGQSLTWRFTGQAEGVTVIQFSSLQLQPDQDTVTISEPGVEALTLRSIIDRYGRLVPDADTFYITQAGAELTLQFDSDLEVEGPGFKLDYAFNDCVQLPEVIDHGYLESIADGLWYVIHCDEGYVVSSPDNDAYPYPIYCDTNPGSPTQYQWVNNHYHCAQVLSGCVAPRVLNGHLELVHGAHYHVVCDCELCSVIGTMSLVCVEVEGVMMWDELQHEHELPVCVATHCATPAQNELTRALHSSSVRVPGSYYREQCIGQDVPDVTRWCGSDGQWSEGFQQGEC